LLQHKPTYGIKQLLFGFARHAGEKTALKRINFDSDLIAYAFVGVSLSDTKFMGGEYLN